MKNLILVMFLLGSVMGAQAVYAEECGCAGQVTNLLLKYDREIEGAGGDQVQVITRNKGVELFNEFITARGSLVTVFGKDNYRSRQGTVGPDVELFVNGAKVGHFHTSCSVPIGSGDRSGGFEIVVGTSRHFTRLCGDISGG